MATATLGTACFWHVEEPSALLKCTVKGVTKTTVGSTGRTLKNPTYEQVCTNTTGHAEVVQLEYDPKIVRYEDLLTVFWSIHGPMQKDLQGPDIGRQYRSVIFSHTEEQKNAAERSLKEEQKRRDKTIITEITKAQVLYPAEDYHQKYVMKLWLKTRSI